MKLIDLVAELKNKQIPQSIQLDKCTFINDVEKFIDSHVSILEHNKGNKTFVGYYNRLLKLNELLH